MGRIRDQRDLDFALASGECPRDVETIMEGLVHAARPRRQPMLGFDWTQLASGAGGLLSSFGGNSGTSSTAPAQQAAEKAAARADAEARRAEEAAEKRQRTILYAGLGILGALLVGGLIIMTTRK